MNKSESVHLIDKMTGLMNYEGFIQVFQELSSISNEQCEDLVLAMLDIDEFMRVNDEYGHKIGDEVIISVANHITNNTPVGTRVFRYAGDEFAILLPNTEKEKAFLIMEKLRESFTFENVEHGEKQSLVTLSIGISCCPEDGNRLTEIVRKSEGALYRAKKGGKNKVSLSREEKMITKTSHYTFEQLKRLSELAKKEGMGEAILLREALDDVLKKYDY